MKHKTAFAVLGAVAIAVVIFVWQSRPQQEPVIRGRDLSWWLWYYYDESRKPDFKLALAEMDARCVQFLIRELDDKNRPVEEKIQDVLPRFMNRVLFSGYSGRSMEHRAQAALLLGKLGPRSKPAIPALRKLAHHSQNSSTLRPWVEGAATATLISLGDESLDTCIDRIIDPKNHDFEIARWAISWLGTNAASAVPRLAQAFHASNDQEFRGRIADPLWFIGSYPEMSVPILKSLLSHQDRSVRSSAIVGLANFGVDAESALPELASLLQSDPSHREMLTNAISRIESASHEAKRSEPK